MAEKRSYILIVNCGGQGHAESTARVLSELWGVDATPESENDEYTNSWSYRVAFSVPDRDTALSHFAVLEKRYGSVELLSNSGD